MPLRDHFAVASKEIIPALKAGFGAVGRYIFTALARRKVRGSTWWAQPAGFGIAPTAFYLNVT